MRSKHEEEEEVHHTKSSKGLIILAAAVGGYKNIDGIDDARDIAKDGEQQTDAEL